MESNGDVISKLRRHHKAEITFAKVTRIPSRIDRKCKWNTYLKSGSEKKNVEVLSGIRCQLPTEFKFPQKARKQSTIDIDIIVGLRQFLTIKTSASDDQRTPNISGMIMMTRKRIDIHLTRIRRGVFEGEGRKFCH